MYKSSTKQCWIKAPLGESAGSINGATQQVPIGDNACLTEVDCAVRALALGLQLGQERGVGAVEGHPDDEEMKATRAASKDDVLGIV